MRTGDAPRRTTIRYLRSAVHNAEIARKSPLDDQAMLDLLGKQAKQRRDSMEAFRQGGRMDLVKREEAELAVIVEYLPVQMSEEEIEILAQRAINETGATSTQEMGKVMNLMMPQLKGKADGKLVSSVVSKLLSKLVS